MFADAIDVMLKIYEMQAKSLGTKFCEKCPYSKLCANGEHFGDCEMAEYAKQLVNKEKEK